MSIQKRLARVFTSHGLTPKAAAGIIGNAYQESSLNPGSVGDGGGGLWGFTAHPNSLSDLQHFAAQHGAHWTKPEIQAKFLLQHLSASDKHALNSQPTARAAASWFMTNWERPYVPTENAARRMDGAQQTFKMIQGLGLKNQARGRMGRTTTSRSSSLRTSINPATASTKTVGGGVNWDAAITDALLTPPKINTTTGTPSSSGDLLGRVMQAVSTGAYTTPQHTTTTIKGASVNSTLTKRIARQRANSAITGRAVADATKAGAPRDVVHLLKMVHNLNGAGYTTASHATAINQRDVAIKVEGGTDCSGFVSWLMGPRGLGIWRTAYATPGIPSAPGMKSGKGRYITLWNNDNPGASGHVFIAIRDPKSGKTQYWASEGGGVGVHQLPLSEVQNYLANGSDGGTYKPWHPKGL